MRGGEAARWGQRSTRPPLTLPAPCAQVFPLLAKHFDSAEQASLVWQFLCSIPVDTVQKLVEWVTASGQLQPARTPFI